MVAIHYTDRPGPARDGRSARALTRAALTAPSFGTERPWRWQIGDGGARLIALPTDPDRRARTIDGGTALHHTLVTLAADGVRAAVERLPDPADPDLLAVLRCVGEMPPDPAAGRLHRAIAMRRSDRRPFADRPVPAETLDRLRAAAEAAGARLHLIDPAHAIVATDGDGPADWLAAGEALSAVVLTAAVAGLATAVSAPMIRIGVAARLAAT